MLSINIIPIMELLLLHKAGFINILKVILLLIPDSINFVFPAAALISTLIVYYNSLESNEIIALLSSGFETKTLSYPVISLAFIVLFAHFSLTTILSPISNYIATNTMLRIAKSHTTSVIKPQIFIEPIPNLIFYISEISPETGMKDVLVMDKRAQDLTLIVVAKGAVFLGEGNQHGLAIRFLDGEVTVLEKGHKAPRNLQFEEYIISVERTELLGQSRTRGKKPKEMTVFEVLQELKSQDLTPHRANDLKFSLYARFFVPICSCLMVIIGFFLPIRVNFHKRHIAISAGVGIFTLYYLTYTGFKAIAESGIINPFLCAFMPVLALIIILMVLSTKFRFIFQIVSRRIEKGQVT